jgi:prepilin-type N-terminal cleavage/methylation domain-containing protein
MNEPLSQRQRNVKAVISAGDYRRQEGFTLIEILLAISILGLVLSTVWAAYSGTMTLVAEMEYENSAYRMARTVLDRMARDLSSVQQVNGAFNLEARKEHLSNHEFHAVFFSASAHLAFTENEIDGSPARIGYFAEEDAARGSFSLRRSDLQDLTASGEKSRSASFVICRNVETMILKFYDATGREYDSWDSSSTTNEQRNKAPTAVRIELVMANSYDKEKPYKFMTKIYLPAKL